MESFANVFAKWQTGKEDLAKREGAARFDSGGRLPHMAGCCSPRSAREIGRSGEGETNAGLPFPSPAAWRVRLLHWLPRAASDWLLNRVLRSLGQKWEGAKGQVTPALP